MALTQELISSPTNVGMLHKYVSLRLLGHPPFMAALGAEVPEHIADEYSRLAEVNDTYLALFTERLAALNEECGWSRKMAILRLQETVNDPYAKRADKTNAIKELNMLTGVTAIDDKGRTVIPTLKDFFSEQ